MCDRRSDLGFSCIARKETPCESCVLDAPHTKDLGMPCAWCGARWNDYMGGMKMVHAKDCVYQNRPVPDSEGLMHGSLWMGG